MIPRILQNMLTLPGFTAESSIAEPKVTIYIENPLMLPKARFIKPIPNLFPNWFPDIVIDN